MPRWDRSNRSPMMSPPVAPLVDVVVLTRNDWPLRQAVRRSLKRQRQVKVVLHRVVGRPQPQDRSRHATIARARNEGKSRGVAPWLMFVDDDVELAEDCIARLIGGLRRRPLFAALGADYLGERRPGEIAEHVAMGATLFRRQALDEIQFRSDGRRCECQCCCDDLRRLQWGVDYSAVARARHLSAAKPGRSLQAHADAAARPVATAKPVPPRTSVSPQIALVACYFGSPPPWIRQYLVSCAYNPSVRFLIFSDQADFGPLPANVTLSTISRDEFEKRAAQKLGFEVTIEQPYKLCDFKPAYGCLFEEHLSGFDYWGYTDLDIVYGDLRRFFSRVNLNRYDVFTARSEYLVGHLTVFRNTAKMRRLFQQSVDARSILSARRTMSFDECGSQLCRRLQGKPLLEVVGCESMTHLVFRLMEAGDINVCMRPYAEEWPDLQHDDSWRFRWREGRLWRVDEAHEAMYLHFHAFRRNKYFQAPPAGLGHCFEITAEGFAPMLSKQRARREIASS